MLESSIEWCVEQINENFQLSADLDKYTFDLGGDALTFAKSVWDVSMILAAVVFAIVACFELYSLSVRNEARGGPMGSAEIVFKVMFKVAVCYVMLQVSFSILQNLYLTSNSLTEAIGGITYGGTADREVINWDEVEDDIPSGFGALGVLAMALVPTTFVGMQQLFRRICNAMWGRGEMAIGANLRVSGLRPRHVRCHLAALRRQTTGPLHLAAAHPL